MLTYSFWHPKTEVRPRSNCVAGPYWGSKSPLCGPSGVQKIVQILEAAANGPISSKDFGNLFHHLSLQLLSLSMLCKNYGIIHFTIGNYTLFGAHLSFLNPQIRGTVEVRLEGGTFLGSKITSVGLPGVQKIVQITERNWKHSFSQWFRPVFCGHRLSLSMLCLKLVNTIP